MKLSGRLKIFTFIICLLTAQLVLMQNCSEVNLAIPQDHSSKTFTTLGNFCSSEAVKRDQTINIIFVVDMSGSNIYWLTSDYNGYRFDAIENFINGDCLQEASNVRYAVVGFSKEILKLGNDEVCSYLDFGDINHARAQINYLRNDIQEYDKDRLAAGTPYDQLFMSETFYEKALGCLNGIVTTHYNYINDPAESKSNNYFSFFITDGKPSDDPFPTRQETAEDYKNLFASYYSDFMTMTNVNSGGGKIQPLYYGNQDSLANEVLTDMALNGNSMPQSISDLSSVDLCDFFHSGSQTRYEVIRFGVANLTAMMKSGQLKADSDMDGLVDSVEATRGFDPTKRRSQVIVDGRANELIDGLCNGLPASVCPIHEDCNESNAMGLTTCDIQSHTLTDGIDSDDDSIPDLLELIKQTRANHDDAADNIDNDGPWLYQELNMGRDPFFADDYLPKDLKIDASHWYSPEPLDSCNNDQESWQFEIKHIPLVPTLATQNTHIVDRSFDFLNHAENENVIFIYYISKASNDPSGKRQLFGQFVKAHYIYSVGQALKLKDEFQPLGEVNDVFVPIDLFSITY